MLYFGFGRSGVGPLWVGVLLLLCVLPATGVAANRYSPDEFGTVKGEPLDTGFFFHEGCYIEAPYVVERRGLDVYINAILVDRGPHSALYEYRVETDPGDPPAGSSPFDKPPAGTDLRDTYWSRKWRYLYSHYDYDTATKKMFDTWRQGADVSDVSWSEHEGVACVTDNKGRKRLVSLSLDDGGYANNQPSKEDILKQIEHNRLHEEKRLSSRVLYFNNGKGGAVIIGGEQAIKTLEILVSEMSRAEKIEALQNAGVLSPGEAGRLDSWIVADFAQSPQLRERLEWVKAEREDIKRREEKPRIPEDVSRRSEPSIGSMSAEPSTAPEPAKPATPDTATSAVRTSETVSGQHQPPDKPRHVTVYVAVLAVAAGIVFAGIWFMRRRMQKRVGTG